MAQRLPNEPTVELLESHARILQQAVRDGVLQAAELVRACHPRLGTLSAGTPEAAAFSHADAQLVLARHYGYASWAKLRQYLEVVTEYSRAPHRQEIGGPVTTTAERVDEFLRLACLNHGDDDPARVKQAAELLAAHPELAAVSIHAAAVAGDEGCARGLLASDPSLARQQGGPYRWEPLLYLAFSALDDGAPGRSRLEVARLLLDEGADPNAGYLWEGLPSPYTALTGALTSPHADPIALARLLLERGADANDSQALYDLALSGDDDDPTALELLFEFGLGRGDGGVWQARLGSALATPAQLVEDELIKAAAANRPRLMRLVLAHGVDVNGRGTNHPIFEGLSAWELASFNDNSAVLGLLDAAGARPAAPDRELEFLGACMRADRAEVDRLQAADPTVAARAVTRRPHHIMVAADKDRLDAVILMTELGFDVNASYGFPHDQTALHSAAFNGNIAMVKFLVSRGADPAAEDCSFHSTPLGWAEFTGQSEVVEYLSSLTA